MSPVYNLKLINTYGIRCYSGALKRNLRIYVFMRNIYDTLSIYLPYLINVFYQILHIVGQRGMFTHVMKTL